MSTLDRLEPVRAWKVTARAFSAWTATFTHRTARVLVRRRSGEPVEAMVARGLDELERRLREGMPEPKPRRRLTRRQLRQVDSPSKAVH